MSNRHLARTIALQTLYQWDFNGRKEKDLSNVTKTNMKEFAPQFDDKGFIENLVNNVIKNQGEIDSMIIKFAPEWPLEQITMVDRNVLRIGIQEMKYDDDIPEKVAINEAIELAKEKVNYDLKKVNDALEHCDNTKGLTVEIDVDNIEVTLK